MITNIRGGYSVKNVFLDFDNDAPHVVVRILSNECNLSLKSIEYFATESYRSVYYRINKLHGKQINKNYILKKKSVTFDLFESFRHWTIRVFIEYKITLFTMPYSFLFLRTIRLDLENGVLCGPLVANRGRIILLLYVGIL